MAEAGASMRLAPTMAASAVSGALARLPCHPIDTVKARLQAHNFVGGGGGGAERPYRHFAHALGSVFRQEGLPGLYRGLAPTVVGSVPASCLYFSTYEVTKSRLTTWVHGEDVPQETPFAVHMAGGMVAETVSCVIWVPVDVIKERMQIQRVPRGTALAELKAAGGDGFYLTGRDAVRSILRTEGVVGFYRGYGATVASFGPFSALYFSFYEQLKRRVEGADAGYVSNMPPAALLLCGALAGAGASFCTNPLDLVKLRLQVQRQAGGSARPGTERYDNMVDGLRKLYAREGARGMLRGVGARMAFHAPATAINMFLFEALKKITYANM